MSDSWESTDDDLQALFTEIKCCQWEDPKNECKITQEYLAKYLRKECVKVHERRIAINMAKFSRAKMRFDVSAH